MKDAIHNWFELSYSNYLVVPRTFLQSMPDEWQEKFVALLEEMNKKVDAPDQAKEYWVRAREGQRFVHDPYADYSRGRRKVPLKDQP